MQEGARDKENGVKRPAHEPDLSADQPDQDTFAGLEGNSDQISQGKNPSITDATSNTDVTSRSAEGRASVGASGTKQKPQPRASHTEEHRILLSLLIKARRASGISQKALSSRLGKAESHVSFLESRDRNLTFVEVARICEIVGLPLEELAKVYGEQVRELR